MSRTYKDSKRKFHYKPYWLQDKERIPGTFHYIQLPTTKPKARKEVDSEDHWMSTPSWWTKMVMNRPERRSAHLLENKVLRTVDLEDFDFPDLGRKPHVYYW